jgi:hypothetical protein
MSLDTINFILQKEENVESDISKPSLASSLVSEGMKVVGNTVSKLSRSQLSSFKKKNC